MRSKSCLLAMLLAACAASPPASPSDVTELVPKIVASYPHDTGAFTQGLLWFEERLYESTGGYGTSSLRRVELETGDVERQVTLDENLFGEGLARVNERLVQLTWREGVALTYAPTTFETGERFSYSGEGWGLCFDQIDLVRSSGTSTLTFHDAGSFAELRSIDVTLLGKPLGFLNELECVHGAIWANVWQTDWVVRIDPTTGEVTARVDAANLRAAGGRGGVLNGIAYREETDTFFLTGKNWPLLFEVRFVER